MVALKTGAGARANPRVCVIGAGPCGLTTLKNLLAHGVTNIACYDDGTAIGGNWAFNESPARTSVYEATHLISSKKMSEFEDYAMPDDYPDFPSHAQMLAYFQSYAAEFGVMPYIRLRTRVDRARLLADGRWSIRITGPTGVSDEVFDHLIVCSGHHREPLIPAYEGHFAGEALHSCEFKRPEPFRDKRVLVVGGGNSGCDIAVELSRVSRKVSLSMRRGYYLIPKVVFGRPVDVLYARLSRHAPRWLMQPLLELLTRLTVGPWERYGLQRPTCRPLEMHPTLNTNILSALRDGKVVPRVGIERFDGSNVRFTDGTAEAFDAIIWATGFRIGFPFLESSVVDWPSTATPPLYLRMMHALIPNLFFVGLFQPLGCIWRLADRQARIAALQITGRLSRPVDIARRISKGAQAYGTFDKTPRHAVEVDYHMFNRELADELAQDASGVQQPPARAMKGSAANPPASTDAPLAPLNAAADSAASPSLMPGAEWPGSPAAPADKVPPR